jgi:hypothetical protein
MRIVVTFEELCGLNSREFLDLWRDRAMVAGWDGVQPLSRWADPLTLDQYFSWKDRPHDAEMAYDQSDAAPV